MKRSRIAILALSFAACAGAVGRGPKGPKIPAVRYEPPPEAQEPLRVVDVWVDEDTELPIDAVTAGCDVWKPLNIQCAYVPTREEAQVRVTAKRGDCKKNDDGTTTLAWATYRDGGISMIVGCMRKGDGSLDTHQFSAVFGHEVGHQLGIWDHVPEDCKDAKKTASSGEKVCGEAIMNAYYEKGTFFITPTDALAFDARDRAHSVVIADDGGSSDPDCVYRVR